MNRGTDLHEAELMLMQWGSWQRGNGNLLGFSNRNVIGRLMDDGPGASQSTIINEPHMPKSVELVEQALLSASKSLQRVAKHRYIGLESSQIAARKLGISTDIYETRLVQAISTVAEYVKIN